jgi:hypothetical protein
MMPRKAITFVTITGAYCVVPVPGAQTKQAPLPSPIDTTVCEKRKDLARIMTSRHALNAKRS